LLRARIVSTGSYVPEKSLTNKDLEKFVETTDEWITGRTGIRARRIAAEGEAASDMAYQASVRALEGAGIKAEDLDLILVGTFTPDMPFPSTGCFLQAKLGATNAVGFDLQATCSGFLYALSVADAYIKSGRYKKVLVVGVDLLSRFLNWEDRSTCVLFGDGAGAVIMEPTEEDTGLIDVEIGSDGRLAEILYIPGGGSRYPASEDTVREHKHCIHMVGSEVFKVAVKTMERISVEILEKNGIDPSEVDYIVPHQANFRIIQAVANRLNMPMDKVIVNLDKYGNTSAGTIPIALDEAMRAGQLKRGDLVLMASFGGGLTWASAIIRL
jgi:3-oxoacyl-[acyl-carrier-protein] synthase-3